MRSALLFAAGCVVCLSQPGFAYEHFVYSAQFSKPNTSYSAFQSDRNACLGAASHQGWHTTLGAAPAVPATPTYNLERFGNCMLAKGYAPDPNGFLAAKFWRISADDYMLARP